MACLPSPRKLQNRFYTPQISLSNSTAQIVVYPYHDRDGIGNIVAGGCYNESNNTHYVWKHMSDLFIFTNNGGRAASLLKVSFVEAGNSYSQVVVMELDPGDIDRYRTISVPLDIEPGTGRIWRLETRTNFTLETQEDALAALNNPNLGSGTLPETSKPAKWEFEFSDGVKTYEYTGGWYHLGPYNPERLCN
jgi:hypothetical protein